MTPSPRQVQSRWPSGLIAPLAILAAAAAALAWDPVTPGHRRAVAFAATICLVGAVGAWIAGCWPAATPWGRVTASLGATALRLFPALIALGWLQAEDSGLQAAHAGELLVVFYLSALAADLIRTIMAGAGTARRPHNGDAI